MKPQQVLTLATGTNYNISVGARLYQETTLAEATVTAFNSTTDPDTITITSIKGSWLSGSLDNNGNTVQGIVSSAATATLYLTHPVTGTFTVPNTSDPSNPIEGGFVVGSSSGTRAQITGFTEGSAGVPSELTVRYVSGVFDPSQDQIDQENSTAAGAFATGHASGGVTAAGDSVNAYPVAQPTYNNDERECWVYHQNHGMHDRQNNVEIEGIMSEITPTSLTAALAADSLSISVESAAGFHTVVNGVAVS